MPAALLADRAVLRVSGAESRGFLQGLLTCDMNKVGPGRAAFGGLLTPQGKILVDFLIAEEADGGFLFDLPAAQSADFLKRLTLYRLRTPVTLEARPDLGVVAGWDEAAPVGSLACFDDPRDPELGWRAIVKADEAQRFGDTAAYDARRIGRGVPEGGRDYAYGDTFPHDANFDLLHGVDFAKGCYVGQEVVSRVQHRGSARKRVVTFRVVSGTAKTGDVVTAGDVALGTIGSVARDRVLALVRVDKLQEALAAAHALRAGDAEIEPVLPLP
jgi:tRNA-modifying protein YgfZ